MLLFATIFPFFPIFFCFAGSCYSRRPPGPAQHPLRRLLVQRHQASRGIRPLAGHLHDWQPEQDQRHSVRIPVVEGEQFLILLSTQHQGGGEVHQDVVGAVRGVPRLRPSLLPHQEDPGPPLPDQIRQRVHE